jgi:hypothetical protein
MKNIVLENLTEEQKVVIDILIREGKLQAYEELRDSFEAEYNLSAPEDPYYAYYVKYVVEMLQSRINSIIEDADEQA